jgi:hypothetical protein
MQQRERIPRILAGGIQVMSFRRIPRFVHRSVSHDVSARSPLVILAPDRPDIQTCGSTESSRLGSLNKGDTRYEHAFASGPGAIHRGESAKRSVFLLG